MKSNSRIVQLSLAAAASLGCLFVSDKPGSVSTGNLVSEAQAVIGRPLTPLSYAGVARRTTRRAVAAGAAMGAAAATAPVYGAPVVVAPAPTCVQVADVYGRVYWRCP